MIFLGLCLIEIIPVSREVILQIQPLKIPLSFLFKNDKGIYLVSSDPVFNNTPNEK